MNSIRKDFPFLYNPHYKKQLIYFDNAATSQKPQQVIDRIAHFYAYENAAVYRGIYISAEQATDMYEQARSTVAAFIGAQTHEIIFTSGTTEGINFIAQAWAAYNLQAGDEIIITELEHHANILPWIRLSQEFNIVLKYIPVTPEGILDYEVYKKLLTPRTKLVSFTLTSNAIGAKTDAQSIIKLAKQRGARVLVDAAQTIAHQKVAVANLGVDFLVFSGHKIMGPTGVGVLYIADAMQNQVQPYQVGGGMVFEVDYCKASWLKSPHKFEAGTPPIAQAIGLAQAINYIENTIDFEQLKKHEAGLCKYIIDELSKFPTIKVLGPLEQLKAEGHIVSFISSKYHPHDIAAYLDTHNICVRAGNHCASLLYKKLGLDGSVRVSFYAYNTHEEVKLLVDALSNL